MKTIFIKELWLRNFKGIADSHVTFFPHTNIWGANESGKSTHYTAFNWLLTGKDELDRKDHEIKNTKRKELNKQAHEVEAVIYTDDNGLKFEHKLKRVYLEKWEKPRGQAEKVFKGHETKFYYNDVERSATEYQEKIDQLIPANLIKLLTNPYYFNSLEWQKQRAGLLMIAGNISDDDVFDSIRTNENNYSSLINVILSGRYKDVEEYRKEIIAKKNLLKKSIQEYPARIDEAKRNIPEEKDWSEIETTIAAKEKEIIAIDELLSDASKEQAAKQKTILAKQKELFTKESALTAIRNKIRSELEAKQNSASSDIMRIETELNTINNTIANLRRRFAENQKNKEAYLNQIAVKESILSKLRDEWKAINAEKFSFDEKNCQCPTCKQKLPASDVEKQKAELLANFNEDVTKRKQSRVDRSNVIKSEIKTLRDAIAALDADDCNTSVYEAQVVTFTDKLKKLKTEQANKTPINMDAAVEALVQKNADALNLQDEIAAINKEIQQLTDALGTPTDNAEEKVNKIRLQREINELRDQLAIKSTIERTQGRIAQLEKEEEQTAQQIADYERHEFEIETYTRAKMDILEQRVNGMFKYVKFRLFSQQVNGGIVEDCVCMYNDVPYTTLNTAAKLLVGIDIINTFSEFYNTYAPIFCDCRESVTWIPESKSQIINLYVDQLATDKKIRVEDAGAIHESKSRNNTTTKSKVPVLFP